MPLKRTRQSCDYEELRNKNLADNKAMLDKLMVDLKAMTPLPQSASKKLQSPQKSKRRNSSIGPVRRNPGRSSRYNPTEYSPPSTRLRARRGSLSSSVSSSTSTSPSKEEDKGKLLLKLGLFWKPKTRRDLDDDSGSDCSDAYNPYEEDEEVEDLPSPKRKPRKVTPREIKSVEDITEQDIEMVAESVRDKSYNATYGTTCHQCRQKTIDQKTICRNKECFGVRGQFCGPCLRNRYGEDAKKALQNPGWICAPCRGICNCSFCRRKAGKHSTGILIHLAREHGYVDVNSYLQSFTK